MASLITPLAGAAQEARTIEALEAFAQRDSTEEGRKLLKLCKTVSGDQYLALVHARDTLPEFSLGDKMRAWLGVGEYNLVTVVKYLERSEIFSHLGQYAEEMRHTLEIARQKLNEKIQKYNSSGWRSPLHEFVPPYQGMRAMSPPVEQTASLDAGTMKTMQMALESQFEERLQRLYDTCVSTALVSEPLVRQWKEGFELIRANMRDSLKLPSDKLNDLEMKVRDFILGFEASLKEKALALVPPENSASRSLNVPHATGLYECFLAWLKRQEGGARGYAAKIVLPERDVTLLDSANGLQELLARSIEQTAPSDDYLHGLILNDIWDINHTKDVAWRTGLEKLITAHEAAMNFPPEMTGGPLRAEIAYINKQVDALAKVETSMALGEALDCIELEIRSLLLEERVARVRDTLTEEMTHLAAGAGRKKSAKIKRLSTTKGNVDKIKTALQSRFLTSQITGDGLEAAEMRLGRLFRHRLEASRGPREPAIVAFSEHIKQLREASSMLLAETLDTKLPTENWGVALQHYVKLIRETGMCSPAVGLNMLGRIFCCRIQVSESTRGGLSAPCEIFNQIIRRTGRPLGTIYLDFRDDKHFVLRPI
jgi:hypothetical protein